MDMDDDFVGEIEFNLTAEQGEIVNRAIELASQQNNEFQLVNPLISIMQWWESSVPEADKRRGSPEATLVEACRAFLNAHGGSSEGH
jgi:hypothetical protein